MEVCWDNINDFKLVKKSFKNVNKNKNKNYYLIENCMYCDDPFFATQKNGRLCTKKCSAQYRKPNQTFEYEDVKKYIESLGLVLLDKLYINNATPIRIQCIKCNYIWTPTFGNLKKDKPVVLTVKWNQRKFVEKM